MSDVNIIAENELREIKMEAKITESYLVGLFWGTPSLYTEFGFRISGNHFMHNVYRFYFDFGQKMVESGVQVFDEITVFQKAKEYNVVEVFEKYGGFQTVEDLSMIVKDYIENIEIYIEKVSRNKLLVELRDLYGDKVLVETARYPFKQMSADDLHVYWLDKANRLSQTFGGDFDVENLAITPEAFFENMRKSTADTTPFYKSYGLNKITGGMPRGHVTMIGSYGGYGKSSLVAEKCVMSWVNEGQRSLVILNEEDAQAFRNKIVLSIIEHKLHTKINRKNLLGDKLTEQEREIVTKAVNIMNELCNEDTGLIKLLFVEKYVMKDVEKHIRTFANRGYVNLLIDTHKVSEDSQHRERWVTFVEDMKAIYRLTRANAGGLNLRTVVTFQLADSSIRNQYLDFEAIGEGKASKNEASIMFMFRKLWSNEYTGKKKELKCYKWVKSSLGTDKWVKEPIVLETDKIYYLLFTPKNRFGESNDTGQPVLVIEPVFNSNHFEEVGWTHVEDDKSR